MWDCVLFGKLWGTRTEYRSLPIAGGVYGSVLSRLTKTLSPMGYPSRPPSCWRMVLIGQKRGMVQNLDPGMRFIYHFWTIAQWLETGSRMATRVLVHVPFATALK